MSTEPEAETVPVTACAVVEIIAGYALILGLIMALFGFAGGIDIRTPWAVMAAIAVLGAGLAGAAWRRRV